MESVKLTIAQNFNFNTIINKPFTDEKFLIVGGPGTGKSSIINSIGNALDLPVIKISLNGINDETFIRGISQTYNNADAGIIIRELSKVGQRESIIWLDEIDKINLASSSISNIFLDLLDDSKSFIDNFLGVPVDLSNVLFLSTANDINQIDPLILDRFSIIELEGYTFEDKKIIAKEYLIPEILKDLSNNITISDEVIEYLLMNYCPSLGLRDLKRSLNKLIKELLLQNGTTSITVSINDVIRILGPKFSITNKFPENNSPGIVRSLGVFNNIGFSLAIETTLIPNESDLTITGLPKESTTESAIIALNYIKTHYKNKLNDEGIHLHFSEGSVAKDGTSAGIAILVSLFSAIYNLPVPTEYAFTGEIDLFGNIYKVGSIIPKIQGAIVDNCTKVFIPESNYLNIRKKDLEFFERFIEVVPFNNASQVFDIVFPEAKDFIL